MFDAFSKQQDLETEYIKASLAETVPLSKTMSEEINRLKSWANGRARAASGVPVSVFPESSRKIEL